MRRPETTDFELVEPGFVSIRFNGRLEAEETTAILDLIEEHVKDKPFFLMEAFMTHIDGASPEARRIAAERLRRLPNRAIAIVGGSFAQRIIAKLVLKAISMISFDDKNATAFFDDSSAARAWLRERAAQADKKTSTR